MRKTLALASFVSLALAAGAAHANFHLIRVEEIYAGSSGNPAAQYVMLAMNAAGQNFVSSGSLAIYDASGTMIGSFTPTNVTNSGVDVKVLIGTSAVQTALGVAPDFVATLSLPMAGGAVCWGPTFDCASWGNFTGTTAEATSSPFNPSTGLVLGMAMRRKSGPMDTNVNSADFMMSAPNPINNAGASGSTDMAVGNVDLAAAPGTDLAVAPGADMATSGGSDMAHATGSSGGGCDVATRGTSGVAAGAACLALALTLALRRRRSAR